MLCIPASARPGLRLGGAFVLLSLMLHGAVSCTRQGEGERCVSGNNDNDCEAPLVCVQADELQVHDTDRCCRPEGESISDERCLRRGSSPATSAGGPGPDGGAQGGAAGSGPGASGTSGVPGTGGASAGGASGSAGNGQGGAGGA